LARSVSGTAQKKVNDAKKAKDDFLGRGRSRAGRNQARNSQHIDPDVLEQKIVQLAERQAELHLAKKKVDEVHAAVKAKKKEIEKWESMFPHRTRAALRAHAKGIRQKGVDYFVKHFRSRDGDLFEANKILNGCATLFNPLWLAEHLNDAHAQLIKNKLGELLPSFGFPEFNNDFIQELQAEVPTILERVRDFNFNWDMDQSKSFESRLEKRRKRLGPNRVDEDWRKDPGEKARRIWEWWRPIVTEDSTSSPAFSKALRLIALIQVSSCAVERVFSQLNMIVETCGCHMLEDMLEVRLFARCNGDLDELFTKAYI